MPNSFDFEIVERLAVLSSTKTTEKALTLTRWKSNTPTIDLRIWRTNHEQPIPCKGVTLTWEEARALATALAGLILDVEEAEQSAQ